MPLRISGESCKELLRLLDLLFPEECTPSLEFREECATFISLEYGDLIGIGRLIKDVGVSNGCANDKKLFGVCGS
jgi:hypothetical protein